MSTNAKRKKSRHGCLRCKERKKKCDEQKPSCLNCVQAGVSCPGFRQQLKWLRKHERYDPSPSPRVSVLQRTPESISGNEVTQPHSLVASPSTLLSPGLDDIQPAIPFHQPNTLDWMFSYAEVFQNGDLPFPDALCLNQPLDENSSLPQMGAEQAFQWSNVGGAESKNDSQCLYETPKTFDTCSCMSDTCEGDCSLRETDYANPPVNQDASKGSFLETFYRMSVPSSTAQFSAEHLIKHYFTHVCSLLSCFDSKLNPFRTIVANEIKNSTTLNLTIQSMSIASLSNHYLYMAPLGIAKRSRAWKSLQSDLRAHRAGQMPLETVLLSLLLLGMTSSWHQPSNFGLPYLFMARTLMQGYFRSCRTPKPMNRLKHEKFFADALMHWEMLASFLDPVPMMGFPGYGMPNPPVMGHEALKMPHPWTAVSQELQFALAEIGRILRRQQKKSTAGQDMHDPESVQMQEERWAAKLEKFLLSIELPTTEHIADYGDRATPKSDLVRIAHAYRFVGLLEIYRGFSHLYEERMNQDTNLPLLYDRSVDENIDHSGYSTALDSFSCAIATEVIDTVKEISISSSACRLLPLVLVSCAGQLRFPDFEEPMDETQQARHDKLVEARYFAESRMLALSRRYPQKQMLQILDIIKETWNRLDNDLPDGAHWMDVMHDKQLQTTLG